MAEKKPRGNPQNLTPLNKREQEAAREIQSKGGKARAKKQRENKLIREQLEQLLSLQTQDVRIKNRLEKMGVEDKTNQAAMILSIYKKALDGDVSAFNSIRDTIGQKPVEKVEVEQIDTNWFIAIDDED